MMMESAILSFDVHLLGVAGAGVGTLVAIALLNRIAPRFGLIDHPDGQRRRHRQPTPLTGGLALFAGLWLGDLGSALESRIGAEVLALLGILVMVHAFDDQSGLSARQRLLIDMAIALAFVVITEAAIGSLGSFGGLRLELGLLALPFTVLLYVAVSNAYNMIDGLDGLALSQLLIAVLSAALWQVVHTPNAELAARAVPLVVAGVVILTGNLGLLGGRFHCFLGDSGARLLGFLLVYLLIAHGMPLIPPILAAYFVALPLLDLCAVVAGRLRAGQGPMQADRRHLHHLLIDAGISASRAVLVMAVLGGSFVALGVVQWALGLGDGPMALSLLALAGLYGIARSWFADALGRVLGGRRPTQPAE